MISKKDDRMIDQILKNSLMSILFLPNRKILASLSRHAAINLSRLKFETTKKLSDFYLRHGI